MNKHIAAFQRGQKTITPEHGLFLRLPHIYIDEIMPALLESEWRVLLVILRQTIGWIDSGGQSQRKERDWISMAQFAKKTGLHRESIGRAVQRLIDLKLIQVETLSGALLSTPVLRRQHGTRLYYRPTELPVMAQGNA